MGVIGNGTTVWLKKWKYPAILLFGIGISNLGAWVYFIALNLIVLNMTGSPFALSVLYIIRPLAGMFANLWAGSVVDRVNKKNAMILLDLSRAALLCFLPLADTLWAIYAMTFIVQAASHVFGNASGVYITKLIPEDQRPRFNSLNSLLGSGAFLLGPAIAGLLFVVGTPNFAILMNAAALLVSGLLTILMPDVERDVPHEKSPAELFTFTTWKRDLQTVLGYYRVYRLVVALCLLWGGMMMVMASAVDSLEAAFATIELGLSESEYGLLVSVAGAGIVAGAVLNALIVSKLSYRALIAIGVLGNGAGYCFYAFSHTFLAAAVGFFILAFFLAYGNTGFATFYQNHVPADIMGRIGSFNGFIESALVIVMTFLFGVAADIYAIRPVIVLGTAKMLLLGLVIAFLCLNSRGISLLDKQRIKTYY